MENIGDKIRNLRKQAGLSQVKLAELVERNPHTIKDYEAGRVVPSWEATVKIAQALGVSQKDLMDDVPSGPGAKMLSSNDLVTIMNQIASLGPTELEILKDTLDSLTKPIAARSKKKEA